MLSRLAAVMFNGAEMEIVLKSDFNKENEVMGKLWESIKKSTKSMSLQ